MKTYTDAVRRSIHLKAKAMVDQMKKSRQAPPEPQPAQTTYRPPVTTDLEKRLARYVAGDRHAFRGYDDGDPLPPEPKPPAVLNAGEKQVFLEHQRQRPALDEHTMALWNTWLDQRCIALMDERLETFASDLGEMSGQNEKKLREDIAWMRGKMVKQLRDDLIKKFGEDLNVMRADLLKVLRMDIANAINTSNVTDIGSKRKA